MCPAEAPFAAEIISSTHSQLTGVLAGFALAGVFLALELRDPTVGRDSVERAPMTVFLFGGFIVGTLAAFLYSSSSGDTGCVAYAGFVVAGAVFSLLGILLLPGIALLFLAREPWVSSTASFVAYVGVAFTMVRFCTTASTASHAFELHGAWRAGISASILAGPLLVVAFAIAKSHRNAAVQDLVRSLLRPAWFVRMTVVAAVGIGIAHGLVIGVPQQSVMLGGFVLAGLVISVLILGVWASLFLPPIRS